MHAQSHMAALVPLLLVALGGCGSGSSTGGTTTPVAEAELDLGNRSFGAGCAVTHEPDADISIVVLPWSGELMLGFALPGDGWEGTCSYHISEIGTDPQTMNQHAAALANAVRAFALTGP